MRRVVPPPTAHATLLPTPLPLPKAAARSFGILLHCTASSALSRGFPIATPTTTACVPAAVSGYPSLPAAVATLPRHAARVITLPLPMSATLASAPPLPTTVATTLPLPTVTPCIPAPERVVRRVHTVARTTAVYSQYTITHNLQ